jgi:hypothetical protein
VRPSRQFDRCGVFFTVAETANRAHETKLRLFLIFGQQCDAILVETLIDDILRILRLVMDGIRSAVDPLDQECKLQSSKSSSSKITGTIQSQ